MRLNEDEISMLNEQIKRLRSEYKKGAGSGTPPSVRLLEGFWIDSYDESDKAFFAALLEAEYCWYGLSERVEKLHREMIRLFPDQPMVWISLASFLMTDKCDFDEARKTIAIGVDKAKRCGDFIRHSLNTQGRIARALEDYRLLETTLSELLELRLREGGEDIAYEDDFIRGISDGKISADLLRLYRSRAPSKHG